MNQFLNHLVIYKIISEDKKEVIKYGLLVIALNLSSIFSIIFVSILLNQLNVGIAFLLFFIPARLLYGGYHCSTIVRCLLLFNILFLIIYFIVVNINPSLLFTCLLCILQLFIPPHFTKIRKKTRYNFFKLILLIFILSLNIIFRSSIISYGSTIALLLSTCLIYFSFIKNILN